MREIKFRAWNVDLKRMGFSDDEHFKTPGWWGVILFREKNVGEIVMQFTGVQDRNGRNIYEGDVVRAASEGLWRTVEVRWRQDANPQWILWPAYHDGKCWYLNGATKQPDGTYKETAEVIGNIYENPELLSKG